MPVRARALCFVLITASPLPTIKAMALPLQQADGWRHFFTIVITLTLGVLGSAVLPIPYAFCRTGIAMGCLTMAVVAFANDQTCCMLVRVSGHTGLTSYEALALWAGGPRFKVFTQVNLILLLYGTLCGGLAFLTDVGRVMVGKAWAAGTNVGGGSATPSWLADGRAVMLALVFLVLYPLCLQRNIRQFERAATLGFAVVAGLCGLLVVKATQAGFPAIRSGDLAVFDFKAFAVIGFAFYMHPMLMVVLHEVPAGPGAQRLAESAVHTTIYGVSVLTYGTCGIFGAALFGRRTEGNILVNDLLEGRLATLALYTALMAYLCCGMVTSHYALRSSVDILLFGQGAPFAWSRHAAETTCIIGAALAVALTFPTGAEKIFALTGATAVCVVCYCIPVFIHLRWRRLQLAGRVGQCGAHRAAAGLSRAAALGGAGGQLDQDDMDEGDGLIAPLLGTLRYCPTTCGTSHEASAVAVPAAVTLFLADRGGRCDAASGSAGRLGAMTGGEPLSCRTPTVEEQGCVLCPSSSHPWVPLGRQNNQEVPAKGLQEGCAGNDDAGSASSEAAAEHMGDVGWMEWFSEVVGPLLIVAIGVGFSVAGIAVAIDNMFEEK